MYPWRERKGAKESYFGVHWKYLRLDSNVLVNRQNLRFANPSMGLQTHVTANVNANQVADRNHVDRPHTKISSIAPNRYTCVHGFGFTHFEQQGRVHTVLTCWSVERVETWIARLTNPCLKGLSDLDMQSGSASPEVSTSYHPYPHTFGSAAYGAYTIPSYNWWQCQLVALSTYTDPTHSF